MVDIKKRGNQIIAITAIGLGAYALLKGTGVLGGTEKGEGSLGGTEDNLSEDQGFRNITADPNTIPEQPLSSITDYYYTTPDVDYINPPQSITPQNPLETTITPITSKSDNTKIDTQTSGLFGSGISAGEASLGVAGLLPSAFTKFGEKVGAKNTDNIFKKVIPEAVKDTPFVGNKLSDLYKPSNVAQDTLKVGTTGIVEVGAKTTIKEIGKTSAKVAVGAIPLIGTAAGAEFDVAVDNRSRPVAYTANVLGDVVGGVLGGITSPLALTGIGGVVPFTLTVGGQVATESLVYGIADTLGGSGKVDQKAVDSALALQYSGTTTANIPQGSSYTFTLNESSKDKISLEEEKPVNNSFWNFANIGSPATALYSQSSSTPVLSSTSKSGTTKSTQTVVTPVSSSGGSSSKDTYKAVSSSKSNVIGQWTNTAGEVTGIKISTAPNTSTSSSKSTTSTKTSTSNKKTYVVKDTKSGKTIRTGVM
jgi:hypothetical protein